MGIGRFFIKSFGLFVIPWLLSSCNPFKPVTEKVRALVIEGRVELRPGECSPQYKIVAYTLEKKRGTFSEDKVIDLNGEADGNFYRDDKCAVKTTSVTLVNGQSEVGFHYKNQINAKAVLLKADVGSPIVPGYLPVGIFKKAGGGPEKWGLDPTFGNGGKVVTDMASSNDSANSVALQSDGKIVAAGKFTGGFALVRYHQDGSLDTSFDSDGKVVTAVGMNSYAVSNGLVIQSDGRIVAGGYAYNGSNYDFALVRYNSNGSLDTSFDGDGKVLTPILSKDDYINDIAIQPDGRIVAAGWTVNSFNIDFAVARYNPNGTLDLSFGGVGKTVTPIGSSYDYAHGVIVQPDGKIVAGGYSAYDSPCCNAFALARYNPNGSLDLSFDGDGKVLSFGGGTYLYSLAIQADRRIVAAGLAYSSGNADFALARYNPNGSLDLSFDGDGLTTTPIGSFADKASSVAIQSDGKIVAAGYAAFDTSSNNDFALARFNSDGSLDTSFSSEGKIITSFSSNYDEINGIVIQSDGKIVVAGYAYNGQNYDIALARYALTSSQDPSLQKLVEDILRDPKNEAQVKQKLKDIEKKLREEEGLEGALAILGPMEVHPDKCTEYTVEVPLEDKDTLDRDLTIKLISESKATFHAKSDCSDSAISQITAKAKSRSTKFYMKDKYTEPILLKAEAKDFVTGYLTVAVRGDLPTKLSLTGPTTVAAGVCSSAYTVTTQDENSEPSFVVADTTITLSGLGRGQAYSDSECTQAISEFVIPFGGAYKSFYFKDPVTENPTLTATYKSSDLATLNVSIRDFSYEGSTVEKIPNVYFTHKKSENAEVSVALSNIHSKYLDIDQQTHTVTFKPNKLTQATLSVNVITAGSIDLSFGAGGFSKVSVGASHDYAEAAALQPDGKLLVAGRSRKSGYYQISLTRLNSNGSLDTSFGSAGKVITKVGKYHAYAEAIALKWDGRIVVGGYADMGSAAGYHDFAVVRYTSAGALDTTFGTGGIITFPIGIASTFDQLRALAIGSDGKILCVGQSKFGSNFRFSITRLNDNGSVDDTFGTGGFVTLTFSTSHSMANDVKILADGKFLVFGSAKVGYYDFALAKFHPNGALDTGFGGGTGKVLTSVGVFSDYGRAIDVQIDGKILVAGYSRIGATDDFALVRYNETGVLDTSFGTGGIVKTALGPSHDHAEDVQVNSEGKIALAGDSHNGSNYDFALAYYNSNGTLDSTYGIDRNGKVLTPVGTSHDYGRAVVALPSSELIVVGSFYNSALSNFDFASVRFKGIPLPGPDPDHPTGSFMDDVIKEIEERRKNLSESNDTLLMTFSGPSTITPSQCRAYALRASSKLDAALKFVDPIICTAENPCNPSPMPPDITAKLGGEGKGKFYRDDKCSNKVSSITLNVDHSKEQTYSTRLWYRNDQPEIVLFEAEPDFEDVTHAFFPVGVYETVWTK